MKKIAVFTAFALAFAFGVFYIVAHAKNLETDIFSLFNFEKNQNERYILKSAQDELAKEFVVLVNSKETAYKIKDIADKSGLFEKFFVSFETDVKEYQDELKRLKIALLDRKIYEGILEGKDEFFQKNARSFFDQFTFRPLKPGDDFFAFSSNLNLKQGKIGLNLSDLMFEVKDANETFYVAKGRLKSGYEPKQLIKFYDELNALKSGSVKILVSSGALYAAFGQVQGDKESVYMSSISLALTILLLLMAFRNLNIFYIVLIAAFGFVCGFAASLAVFERLHMTVVVISTSLVGLMFDYVLHWLGKNQNVSIEASSIRSMRKIFLLGLFITTSGYAVFAFAPLEMLKQIAIFSLFTLFGAFLFTYFCMPLIFEGEIFTQSAKFQSFLHLFYRLCLKILARVGVKFIAISFALLLGFLLLNLSDLTTDENIKDYSSSPKFLLQDTYEISKSTGASIAKTMIVVKNSSDIIEGEKRLISELERANLITGYSSLSKIFLSKREQENLKEAFKRAQTNPKIIKIYTDLGFDKDDLNAEFEKISQAKTLKASKILNLKAMSEFGRFLLDENTSLVYVDGFVKNAKSDEILATNDAFGADFTSALNKNLSDSKKIAAALKIVAFGIAFIFLWLFFSFKISALIMSLVGLGVMMTLSLFVLFGIHVNIFAVFGLILASAVGIDYMIFALNDELNAKERIFGIFMAAITSFISFFMLFFSTTNAISVFGLAVSLNVAIYALIASVLSVHGLREKQLAL
ncbi:hypothetical protein [Campylobacter curvus]|uniref:hypothetical protein n=1 Tax=Campylobacter curvus TaxID=200 RepID=UPI00146FFD13|nr:hypothetical protein [Campylobacter curvus]